MMSTWEWAVSVYVVLFCLLWFLMYLHDALVIRVIPIFEQGDFPQPSSWPRLSIVIAACNEADTIGDAITTLLQQDYPQLEIIVVNDRSTDNTGILLDDLAKVHTHLKVIHVEQLPDGWLGKVHALHIGSQQVTGSWILFTDADVHFAPGTLRRAMAYTLERDYDHLSLLPQAHSQSFWLDVVVRTFGFLLLQNTRVRDLDKPGSNASIGIGAFNLVRKSLLHHSVGFPWLRMEVADDVGLGMVLQRAGARSGFAAARKHVSVTWYASIAAMFRGLEKNIYGTAAHYRLGRLLFLEVFMLLFILAPFVGIGYSIKLPYLWPALLLALGMMFISIVVWWRKYRNQFLPMVLIPIGQLIIVAMILWAGIMCIKRGGILWRGTLYPVDQLRRGQRMRF